MTLHVRAHYGNQGRVGFREDVRAWPCVCVLINASAKNGGARIKRIVFGIVVNFTCADFDEHFFLSFRKFPRSIFHSGSRAGDFTAIFFFFLRQGE